MSTNTTTSWTIGRLLNAVLICLCVVFSQIAHAETPSVSVPDHVSMVDQAVPCGGSAEHVDATDHSSDPSGSDHHDGKSLDMKCAMHCPSVFVSEDADDRHEPVYVTASVVTTETSLLGRSSPRNDRPPRA